MARGIIRSMVKGALSAVHRLRALDWLRARLFAATYPLISDDRSAMLWFSIFRPDHVQHAIEVQVVDHDGLRFLCRPKEHLDGMLIQRRVWEPHTRSAMKQVLRPGDVFFDVGAHIGTETLFGSRLVGPQGRVVSFEPAPWVLPRLVRHVEMNGAANVSILNVAVAAEPGVVTLKRAAGNDGRSRVGDLSETVTAAALCQAVTLDDVWRAMGRPDVQLVKIDVEGHEPLVLRGGAELLKRVPHLLLEAAWDVEYRANASRNVLEELRSAGWRLRHWDGLTWAEGVPSAVVECDIWATHEVSKEKDPGIRAVGT
jgi:FkbM family methyltransferase